MRRVAHGVVWFPEVVRARVSALMQAQSSAARAAYQAIHKHGLKGNSVKQYVKRNFMALLNQRYVADAASRVAAIKDDGVLFGGARVWQDLKAGRLSREEWRGKRNGQLYSRGDRTKKGNPNIRVVGGKLLVNDPSGRGKWLEGKLFIPDKWQPVLDCYDARLIYRDGQFEVAISWSEDDLPKLPVVAGAIGIDANPDGVAVTEVSADGNLQQHHYEREQRLQFAGQGKRDYDVKQLAARVVKVAKDAQKLLVVEKLAFGKGKRGYRKFRRMKSNFLHRQILEAVKSRASREGVPVVEVNPAFTSILGMLKYQQTYSLNRHTAAALVIARRGMDLQERQDFTVMPTVKGKGGLNLEGRGHSTRLSPKAYSWLEECFLKPKPARLTASTLVPDSKPGIDVSTGEIPVGESPTTTGRWGVAESCNRADERLPSSLDGKIFQAS